MTSSLSMRFLLSDLRRSPGVTVALLVVLVLSAFLMSSGAMVVERLSSSVTRLFETAQPPHFLQMHRGDYDEAALERFAAHSEIDAWQIEEMVGFDGQSIAWERSGADERGDLSRSLIDNLFVTQNAEFDFLLDDENRAPTPPEGEVYVPVAYAQEFGLAPGDRLAIDAGSEDVVLRVAGSVRDAQMASSMSSATRFLVSEPDFERLREAGGDPEIIVEYRFSDASVVNGFQRDYEADPALPKNGQAVTEVMIRVVNMFSDGLAAAAFVFSSLLLIAIALLNVRFVIRGTLEDEVHEIGAMRAIGIPGRTISRLYLLRYGAMALIACLVGGALSVPAVRAFTSGIRANFAEAPPTVMTVLAPVLALLVVLLLVVWICASALRTVGRMDIVGALVRGETAAVRQRRRKRRADRTGRSAHRASALGNASGRRLGLRLALLDLRAERRQWALIPAVLFLAAVLVALPANLLSTFESPRFVGYLGAPESDVRADVQFVDAEGEDVDSVQRSLVEQMRSDDRFAEIRAFAGVLYETPGEEGWEALRVEVGDYDDTALEFVEGRGPGEGEIALSALNADKLGATTGDRITVRRDGAEREVVVSGIYQDVTSGGFTAKMQGEIDADAQDAVGAEGAGSGADRWVVYADLVDGADPAAVAAEYAAAHPAASVIPMHEYVAQTLSYVTGALRSAAWLSLAFGLGAVALITTLFLRLRIGKDRAKMGTLAAIGFSIGEIIGLLRLKTLLTVAGGALLGVVFAATVGEFLVGRALALTGLGVSRLEFSPEPWIAYALHPLLLIAAGTIGAIALTSGLRRADRSGWLR